MYAPRLDYALAPCSLGWLLLAATQQGVCFVGLGDDRDDLEQELRNEFPYAELSQDDVGTKAWREALVAYVDGRAARIDIPLDVRASRFQRRVWDALCAIPRGETRSYADVAASLGRPTAARAVARACATNPVALAIPCHRVVPRRADAGGYRWGEARKCALLELEAAD